MKALAVFTASPAPAPRPDAIAPQALTAWPFGALTTQQQIERRALEHAMQTGALRGLPSVFGELQT